MSTKIASKLTRSIAPNIHHPRWKRWILHRLGMGDLEHQRWIEEDLEAYTLLIADSMREIIRNRLDGSPEIVTQERMKIQAILDLHHERLRKYLEPFRNLKTDQVVYAENHCVFAAAEVFRHSSKSEKQ